MPLRVKSHARPDFLRSRREAAVEQLLKSEPEPTVDRDQVLLRILGRESRNAGDMEPYRKHLFSEDSQCEEYMSQYNNKALQYHPRNGMTFDELQTHLEKSKPVYRKIAQLSSPLPQTTFFRRNKEAHAKSESADGRFDNKELFGRGFRTYISAIYVADGTDSISKFGDTTQTVKLKEDTHYLDYWDDDVQGQVGNILNEAGVDGEQEVYDVLYKSGIEAIRYRPSHKGESWYNIFNPAVVESLTIGDDGANQFPLTKAEKFTMKNFRKPIKPDSK